MHRPRGRGVYVQGKGGLIWVPRPDDPSGVPPLQLPPPKRKQRKRRAKRKQRKAYKSGPALAALKIHFPDWKTRCNVNQMLFDLKARTGYDISPRTLTRLRTGKK